MEKLLLQNNHLMEEINDAHMQLSAVIQVMDLTLADLYDCFKHPDAYMKEMRKDRLVLDQQRNAIYDVMKRFEQIYPDGCDIEIY